MDYDVIIVGAGSGGIHAAKLLAKHSKNVALIESNELGGVCLNNGCIPVKSVLERNYINAFSAINDIESITCELKEGIQLLLNTYNVNYINAHVTEISRNSVTLITSNSEKQCITASYIVIATGSQSYIPNIFSNVNNLITSENLWEHPVSSSNIAIIGGGTAGCEIACALSKFNNTIHLFEKSCDIIQTFTKRQRDILKYQMNINNIIISENCNITDAFNNGKQICLKFADETLLTFDYCIVCTGRKGNLSEEMIQIPELILDEKCFINSDFYGNTAVSNVFCIGDANGQKFLANYAEFQGECVANKILGIDINPCKNYLKYMPECVFTDMQLAKIGSCPDKSDNNSPIVRGIAPLYASGMGKIKKCENGEIAVFRNTSTDLIEGGYIAGDNASEIIHILQIYIINKIPCKTILQQPFIHPSISEAVKIAIEETYNGSVKVRNRRKKYVS